MYIDRDYVKSSFAELDKLAPDTVEGNKLLDSAITTAQSIVDNHLRNISASVPLQEPDGMVKYITCQLTIYQLYDGSMDVIDIPDSIQKKFDNGMKLLKGIAAGDTPSPVVETDDGDEDAFPYQSNPPKINRGTM
jgi:phage gp36-like protein